MPRPITVKGFGLSVELLLFRAYGAVGNTGDMLKRTLALNLGLSRHGAELPIGTDLVLADPPAAPVRMARPAVSLFDDE